LYAIWEEILSIDAVAVLPASTSAYLPYLKKDDMAILDANVTITGNISRDVSWTTSASAVVEIVTQTVASCQIKAKASGTAVIKATSTVDPTKFFEYQVTAFTADDAGAMASGGTRSFLRTDSGEAAGYYELHTFNTAGANQSLNVARAAEAGKTWLLLVAGGGGGGGATWPGGGGGAGGYGEDDAYTLPAGTYTVTVGGGGTAGNQGGTGGTGGDSSLAGGSITTIQVKGGGGGVWRSGPDQNRNGNAGGSCGGNAGYIASRPVPSAGSGLAPDKFFGNAGGGGNSGQAGNVANTCGGGGGAGGPGTFVSPPNQAAGNYTVGKGPGKSSLISGSSVIYAEGGPLSTNDGQSDVSWTPSLYGSGGQGGWNGKGGNGKSGIVIVRLRYR
jgi:hypothetical protein